MSYQKISQKDAAWFIEITNLHDFNRKKHKTANNTIDKLKNDTKHNNGDDRSNNEDEWKERNEEILEATELGVEEIESQQIVLVPVGLSIVLHVVQGLSYKAVAVVTSTNESVQRKHTSRCTRSSGSPRWPC